MRKLTTFTLIAAATALIAGEAAAYGVYCANGKIEIDSRSPEQMRIARGSNICSFGQFNFATDAENFAKKNNFTPGKTCSCR